MNRRFKKLVLVFSAFMAFLGGLSPVLAVNEGWMEDFEKAKAKATQEGKDILLDFTGSDWCGWCIKLHEEVFDKAYFKTEAPKSLILVSLDFPRDKSIVSPAIAAQNKKLQKEFNVRGYPTIFLVDAKGKPFAEILPAYKKGGPENYVKILQMKQTIRIEWDEYLAKMAGAKPKDKAQWLDKALTVIPNNILLAHYKEELNAIKSMETDGSTSFKDKYELLETIFGLETRLGERKIDTEAIVKDIDAALAKYKTTKEQTQSLYLLKFQTLQRTQPPTGTEALLDQAYAAAPDSDQAEKIKGMKSYYFPKLVLPATLKSSIIPYSGQQEIKAFDGDKDSFFVGSKPPQKDDTFELALTKAQAFKTATVFTGHSNHPKLILDKGVLEISYDGQTFTQAAQFEEGKATATLNGAPLKAVRIKVTEGQKQMLIISEIVLE